MAQLTVMGPWIGPGEERTARFLEEQLPKDWEIIASRKLPGEDRSDVDLIVVGSNLIFVVEEKAWGPTVVIGDERWWVGRDERRSPLNATAHKARVLATVLKDRISAFRTHVYAQRVVRPVVILSHERVTLTATKQASPSEIILALSQSASELQRLDLSNATDLRLARDSVVTVLKDLGGRDTRALRVGPYRILEEQPSIGRIFCFLGEHQDTGEEVHLRCFPQSGWGDGDPSSFFRRETRALARLADENRTWRFHPPFEEEERSWFVVPVVPPRDRRSLAQSVNQQDPIRPDGTLPADITGAVVGDAFRALADVHDKHLLHRILCPERIWLGRGMRVHFSDFYLAKIRGDATVLYWAQEDVTSEPFRAPECAESLVAATEASDVYSLTLSLVSWWRGELATSPEAARLWLAKWGALGDLLTRCLEAVPADRPKALDVAATLTEIAEAERSALLGQVAGPDLVEFVDGARIAGRYELRRKLGEGGIAVSWLAYDDQREIDVVVKQLRSAEIASLARQEFNAAREIHDRRCARVWDILDSPAPGVLVHDYMEGESLRQRMQLGSLSVETVRKIAVETLDILETLHEQGKVHGDISPGNIVVDDNSSPVLIDFGLMARIGERPIGGTPSTMAPELLHGASVTAQCDIYSLACTLIQATLGRPPYVGLPELGPARDSTLNPPTEAEHAQWGEDGAALIAALFKGAEPDPANRPLTARQFAEDIRTARGAPGPVPDHWTPQVNPTVYSLRTQYRGSRVGNVGNRGLDDPFAVETYVPTQLDLNLLPAVVRGDLDVVLLTGNPGDGKTSFLVAVKNALIAGGGQVERDDEAGWQILSGGRSYAAVYDASESHEGISSDDLVHGALRPVASGTHTALLAVNDGRLLQFFTDYRHEYPDLAREVRRGMDGKAFDNGRLALVDLKQRALAGYTGMGLALEIADTFTQPPLWDVCLECASQTTCPILQNVETLRGSARNGVGELVLTSHLRRRRRATVRDVRSALAWMITGDLSCEQVHEATSQGRDLTRGEASLLPDLVFSSSSGDYLISEWAELDPAAVIAPVVERAARSEWRRPGSLLEDRVAIDWALRLAFLEAEGSSMQIRRELRSYRYFEEYVAMVQEPDDDARDRILLGLSRIAGAPGFSGSGLGIGERSGSGNWAVLKQLDEKEFVLSSSGGPDPYIESIADRLKLVHIGANGNGAANLPLTLDTAELILRAADGEILGDAHSEALRQEVEAFAAKLRRQLADSALIVDPAGVAERVVRRAGTLQRVVK
jgi:serine/threonine protein kinase